MANTTPQKIMVVEDDKFLRELLVKKLIQEGYGVAEVADGGEVMRAVLEEKPHLILLDLILPGIDGFEALKQIRDNQDIGKIPVIILSNLGQKDEIEKGLQLGADDYLIKAHFTPGEIIDKVKKILRSSYV